MAEITTEEVREFLRKIQGQEITLNALRTEFQIKPDTKSFDGIRNIMWQLAQRNEVSVSRKGVYKVVKQVSRVNVLGIDRKRKPPFDLVFPKDFDTGMQMLFAEYIVIREGDLILIAGMSNFGKTTLAMNFCAENIEKHPVLMGNEYTTLDNEPTPRFLNRLDAMAWVEWVNSDGQDKFELFPVWEDYPEHIVKDRINIIDWIDLPGEYYLISPIMASIKKGVGSGVGVIVIQKDEGTNYGRGKSMTKDFADCELLLDKLGDYEVLLTVGKVKEYTKPVTGKTYAYGIGNGVKILNFREVKKCPACYGKGYTNKGECDDCFGKKYVDR